MIRLGSVARRYGVALWGLALSVCVTFADQPRLYWTGTFGGRSSEARGVSADGTVVGWTFTANGQRRAFRWTRDGGIEDLGTLGGTSEAYGISADGRTIVGYSTRSDLRSRAVRWVDGVGPQDLGGDSPAQAVSVSADGSVIVGQANLMPVRWTEATGMQRLTGFPAEWQGGAWRVSANGAVIAGTAFIPNSPSRAFRWENGSLQLLPALHSGSNSHTAPSGVSADGRVIVGQATAPDGFSRAVRWVDGRIEELGTLGGRSFATGVSADGRRIVGVSSHRPSLEDRAFLWIESQGMIDLQEAYASLLPPGARLIQATGISPDGRFIIGIGINPETRIQEGFLLDTIPEPASLLALSAGLTGLWARRRRQK